MGDKNVPPPLFKSVKICVICCLFLPPLCVLGELGERSFQRKPFINRGVKSLLQFDHDHDQNDFSFFLLFPLSAPFVLFAVPSFLASFARVYALLQVEAIEIHHLDPRVHEVAHELFLPIVASVDFGDGSEFGV